MSKTRERILIGICSIICILLLCVKLTGGVWHVLLGELLSVGVVIHICIHGRKWKAQKKHIQITDWILMASFVIMLGSGMLMHPLEGSLAVKIVHKLFGVLFLLMTVVHVIQHKKTE